MKLKLKSSDGQIHEVDRKLLEKSSLIKNMIEDIGEDSDNPIPIAKVESAILKSVIEWVEHHQNDPVPDPSQKPLEPNRSRDCDDIDDWDREFCRAFDNEALFKLILAANYMEIKPLMELGCKTVANMIKGKTAEQIRETFGLVNDFTPEEEEQIRRENAWAEEAL